MEKVVLRNNDIYRDTIDRIKLLIMKKAVYEKRAQNQENRTMLGNVSFWFQKQPETENHYLIFDKPTELWRIEDINEDVEKLEYVLAKQFMY